MSSEPTDETPLQPIKPEAGDVSSTPKEEGKEIDDAPPKYERLLGIAKIRKNVDKAKSSSNKVLPSLLIFEALSGSAISLICFLIFSVIPIAMIVIGSVYLHGCPGQRLIPIWLIVFGCFSLLQILMNVCRSIISCCNNDLESDSGDKVSRGGGCCECILFTFLFIWLIVGSVWVFSYHGQPCPTNAPDCCASVPYLFSFWIIISIYVLSLLSCVVCCTCFFGCCACLLGIAGKSASSAV